MSTALLSKRLNRSCDASVSICSWVFPHNYEAQTIFLEQKKQRNNSRDWSFSPKTGLGYVTHLCDIGNLKVYSSTSTPHSPVPYPAPLLTFNLAGRRYCVPRCGLCSPLPRLTLKLVATFNGEGLCMKLPWSSMTRTKESLAVFSTRYHLISVGLCL